MTRRFDFLPCLRQNRAFLNSIFPPYVPSQTWRDDQETPQEHSKKGQGVSLGPFTKAKEAVIKAGKYARRDRRTKKRTFRALWIIRLNNALRANGTTYATFISLLKTRAIALDRKVLSEMAVENPNVFTKFVESVLAK